MSEPRPTVLWLALVVLVVATVLAYASSLSAPFVFDDVGAITENASIRSFSTALSPPPEAAGAVGRPLVNLTLAANYALGGLEVRGYRLFNLAVHAAAGLLLFGCLRRTFGLPVCGPRLNATALPVAFSVALLWLVHPLQTESVLGVVQRSELLAGFFLLLVFYAFLRANASASPLKWKALMVAACWLGVATKELLVTAPFLLLLFDRAFVAGSFRAAWNARWREYLALLASWLLLAWLVAGHAQRSGTAGFGLGVTPWTYLLTQCEAIVLYLKLVVWPHPLVLDYGEYLSGGLSAVWPQALLLVILALGTVWSCARRPTLGFLGAWFFVILAPSSSVIPLVTQTIAEHRMYLPLIPVLIAGVLLLHRGIGLHAVWLWSAVAVGLIFMTIQRGWDYRSERVLWTRTVEDRPQNARAHYNLAALLVGDARPAEAISHYERALAQKPVYADAHLGLGNQFFAQGRIDEAAVHFTAALRDNPSLADAHYNLANIFAGRRAFSEAIPHYEAAARLDPQQVGPHVNLANVLVESGRETEAIEHYQTALRLVPQMTEVHYNLGTVLLRAGRAAEAAAEFEAVLRADPTDAAAARNLARARQLLNR